MTGEALCYILLHELKESGLKQIISFFYKKWSLNVYELKILLIYYNSDCYVTLLLAPVEGWWPLATSRWPSATWEGPSGPPNDFLYSEWAYLGGQFSDIL